MTNNTLRNAQTADEKLETEIEKDAETIAREKLQADINSFIAQSAKEDDKQSRKLTSLGHRLFFHKMINTADWHAFFAQSGDMADAAKRRGMVQTWCASNIEFYRTMTLTRDEISGNADDLRRKGTFSIPGTSQKFTRVSLRTAINNAERRAVKILHIASTIADIVKAGGDVSLSPQEMINVDAKGDKNIEVLTGRELINKHGKKPTKGPDQSKNERKITNRSDVLAQTVDFLTKAKDLGEFKPADIELLVLIDAHMIRLAETDSKAWRAATIAIEAKDDDNETSDKAANA